MAVRPRQQVRVERVLCRDCGTLFDATLAACPSCAASARRRMAALQRTRTLLLRAGAVGGFGHAVALAALAVARFQAAGAAAASPCGDRASPLCGLDTFAHGVAGLWTAVAAAVLATAAACCWFGVPRTFGALAAAGTFAALTLTWMEDAASFPPLPWAVAGLYAAWGAALLDNLRRRRQLGPRIRADAP